MYEFVVPQLVITSSVNLEAANGKGSVVLDWSDYDISDKYFVVYRKSSDLTEWQKIVSLEDKFNENEFIDTIGNDKKAPCFPSIVIDKNSESNEISIDVSSSDVGTKYSYCVEAYDSKSLELLNVNGYSIF